MRSRSPSLDQAVRPGQARPAAPSDAVSRPSSRSSRQSSGSPPIARRARLGGPGPSEPRGHGPRGNTGELASSWLHPLKSWSLRETRDGSQHPDPQRLVAAGQRRAGEIVEAPGTRLAAIPLPIGLSVVVPVLDHRVTTATGAAYALRPAALAHKGEALGFVHQAREVDQVGCSHSDRYSLHGSGQLPPLAPKHQASIATRPGPNLTTPEPDKGV